MEDFLETDERSGDVARVDFESRDNQRQPDGPFLFATGGIGDRIPDVVGEEADRNGGRVLNLHCNPSSLFGFSWTAVWKWGDAKLSSPQGRVWLSRILWL